MTIVLDILLSSSLQITNSKQLSISLTFNFVTKFDRHTIASSKTY